MVRTVKSWPEISQSERLIWPKNCWPYNNNLLLTEREGRTGEYWPEVVTVRTERSEVCTKTTEGQYSPERLELARLVSSLLYGFNYLLALGILLGRFWRILALGRFCTDLTALGPYCQLFAPKWQDAGVKIYFCRSCKIPVTYEVQESISNESIKDHPDWISI